MCLMHTEEVIQVLTGCPAGPSGPIGPGEPSSPSGPRRPYSTIPNSLGYYGNYN